MQPILFPNLNLSFDIQPVAFNLFGKDIYWYGILIMVGMIIGLAFLRRDDGKYGLKWDDVSDFCTIAIVVGVICARLYYVIFKWEYYINHLDEIYKIWNGGLAIYGGVIGAIVVAFVFCKKKKIDFLSLCDYCIPYLPLAQSIGRWGNFINREAYGAITDSFLKMGIFDVYSGEYIFVHPTFFYESLLDFGIFMFLFIKSRKSNENGSIFYWYMFLYGAGRAMIEGLRADSLYFFHLKISQILSIVFVITFGILLILQKNKILSKKVLTKMDKYGKF